MKKLLEGKGVRMNGSPIQCGVGCHHQATKAVKLRFGKSIRPTFVCTWHSHWFTLKLAGYTLIWRS